MSLRARFTENRAGALVGAALALALGLLLCHTPLGNPFLYASYDFAHIILPEVRPQEAIIIKMDELAYRELNQTWGKQWDRSLHTRLLDKLRADGCRLVVFDVTLSDPGEEAEDAQLAQAIQRCGRVVLAGDEVQSISPRLAGPQTVPPREIFRKAAAAWGIALVEQDSDYAVRRLYAGTELDPSLYWAAAALLPEGMRHIHQLDRLAARWLRYYGPYGTVPSMSYNQALAERPGYFANRIVFIGGQPRTRFTAEERDEFRTPYTRWDGQYTSGVEIEATMFLNLIRGDWLTRWPEGWITALVVVTSLLFGFSLALVRPLPGVLLAIVGFTGLALLGLLLVALHKTWFPWMIPAAGQIGCALVWALIWHLRKVQKATPSMAAAATAASSVPAYPSVTPAGVPSSRFSPVGSDGPTRVETTTAKPQIPDHELIGSTPIGGGSYGEVWLARNVLGGYRAVKIVHRSRFQQERPYEREFEGLQRYEPVSRSHTNLVQILQVGRNSGEGYFYYVMELGDDEVYGHKIVPEKYSPRNLAKELARQKKFPVSECLDLGIALSSALGFLHSQQLIHRDIKPANIIFVQGRPKLADVGLVTALAASPGEATYLGTEGYIAPEGPGTPAADVYSLGKVLYEVITGQDRRQFPSVTATLTERPDYRELIHLLTIVKKACVQEAAQRFQTVMELHQELTEYLRQLAEAPPS